LAHRLFLRELRDYRNDREPGLVHSQSKVPDIRLLADSYLESAEMALERAITALSLWYDPKPLSGVLERLRTGDRAQAAPALEYLGHALPRQVFRPLSRVFEPIEAPDDESRFRSLSSLIEAAWESGDAWLRACAVRASRHVPQFDASRFAEDDHPLVRAEIEALKASPHASPQAKAATC
jgi:hypothetical protein